LQIAPGGPVHLTYCTNIHPGSGWAEVAANIARYAPALKRRFAPHSPFGLGLRLSAREARELLATGFSEFAAFLDREGLYVAILNGFPYGPFHRSVVKADVYAPDWRDEARLRYTLDLIEVLRRILPEGLDGGVSTAPISYKPWMTGMADWSSVVHHLVRVTEALVAIRRDYGKLIHLDVEPEPDCTIENTGEAIEFFETRIFGEAARRLASGIGCGPAEAREHLRDHIQLCFDCCHFAVEYEDPIDAMARLTAAGIRIGRVQLSSALRAALPADPAGAAPILDRLRTFADSTYLHQVIQRRGEDLQHFPDLPDALLAPEPHASEWRIHFHVPLFTSDYDGLQSTQGDVARVLAALRDRPLTTHLEIETYTWDVLPGPLKNDLLDSIGREYDWVLATWRQA
jgi:sugar phosphate isomerase/epimerase